MSDRQDAVDEATSSLEDIATQLKSKQAAMMRLIAGGVENPTRKEISRVAKTLRDSGLV
jgi:hypothetical protein